MKFTPAQRKALEWLRQHEPVSAFPNDGLAPSLRFIRQLRKNGFVEEVGKEPGVFGFTKFGTTELARSLLSPSKEKA